MVFVYVVVSSASGGPMNQWDGRGQFQILYNKSRVGFSEHQLPVYKTVYFNFVNSMTAYNCIIHVAYFTSIKFYYKLLNKIYSWEFGFWSFYQLEQMSYDTLSFIEIFYGALISRCLSVSVLDSIPAQKINIMSIVITSPSLATWLQQILLIKDFPDFYLRISIIFPPK